MRVLTILVAVTALGACGDHPTGPAPTEPLFSAGVGGGSSVHLPFSTVFLNSCAPEPEFVRVSGTVHVVTVVLSTGDNLHLMEVHHVDVTGAGVGLTTGLPYRLVFLRTARLDADLTGASIESFKHTLKLISPGSADNFIFELLIHVSVGVAFVKSINPGCVG